MPVATSYPVTARVAATANVATMSANSAVDRFRDRLALAWCLRAAGNQTVRLRQPTATSAMVSITLASSRRPYPEAYQ
jgi:hypothetical protein